MMTTQREKQLILQEIRIMTAAGWRLYRHGPDGAIFVSGSSGSGISAGVHLVLLVLTLGLWFPFLVIVELAGSSRPVYCRLTFDPYGQPTYEMLKRSR
jgi:hypothetical protein